VKDKDVPDPRDWARAQQLKAREKSVLTALAAHVNRKNSISHGVAKSFPKIPNLAAETGLSESSIRRALTILETKQLVWRWEVSGPHGQTSSSYVLNLSNLEDLAWIHARTAIAENERTHRFHIGRKRPTKPSPQLTLPLFQALLITPPRPVSQTDPDSQGATPGTLPLTDPGMAS
jgi:hypothetical protein